MFFKNHFEQMRSSFLRQFEADGHDHVYRKNMKGAPIRVSATERDAFAADFVRRVRYIGCGLVVATVLLCAVPVLIAPDMVDDMETLVLNLGIAGIIGLCLAAAYWAWTAPARALVRRPAVGLARSRSEMRRRAFAQITYGQLALCLPVATLLVLSNGIESWWTSVAGGLVIMAGVQAVRKWRFDRNRDH